jgi:Metallo-peptidase family M12/Calx-beta domain
LLNDVYFTPGVKNFTSLRPQRRYDAAVQSRRLPHGNSRIPTEKSMNTSSSAPKKFAAMKALLLFCGLQTLALAAVATPQILGPVPQEKFTLATLKSLSNVYVQSTKTATMAVTFNASALQNLPIGGEAMLSLPNGQQYVYRMQSSSRDRYGNLNVVAVLKDVNGKDSHYKLIATAGASGSFATIETPDDVWSIVPGTGSGFDYLFNGTREAEVSKIVRAENDAIVVPEDQRIVEPHAEHDHVRNEIATTTLEQDIARTASNAFTKVAPSPQRTIDVMVVVSQGFANFHGANLEARISQAFNAANAAYVLSDVAITISKVGPTIVRNTPDPAGGATKTDLDDLTGNVGAFADLEDLRWAYGADLVTLFRQPPPNTGSGIAWVGAFSGAGASEVWAASEKMYSVVDLCNFAGCDVFIFAHELGHNMGLQHDYATVLFFKPDYVLPPGVRPYAFGHKVATNDISRDFYTIMSYPPPNRPVAVFSNPNLFICNPAGYSPADACGVANIADNARVLNENRNMLASIRTAQQVGLSTTTTLLSATDTTATLQVSRAGATTTAISVNYQTVNGTATAGVDYVATAGTLTWAANDNSIKTITVPLIYTGIYVDRTFTVSLSGPVRASFTVSDVTLTRQSLRSAATGCPVSAP